MVQDIRTKNAVIQALLESIWKIRSNGKCGVPDGECVNIIYQGTTAGSCARRLLVDLFTYAITHEHRFKGYPKEFLEEFAREITKARLVNSFSKGLKMRDGAEKYLETEEKMND